MANIGAKTLLFLIFGVIVSFPFSLFGTPPAATAAFAQTFSQLSPLPHHYNEPLRLFLTGTFTVNVSYVRIANAVTGCLPGSTFAGINVIPTGTIGLPVGYTAADHRPNEAINEWNVQLLDAGTFNFSTAGGRIDFLVSVCLSSNAGVSWVEINNGFRNSVRMWRYLPTAAVVPRTPKIGVSTRIYLPATVFINYTATSVFGAVVAAATDCDRAAPLPTIAGGASVAMDSQASFTFTLTASAATAFLCISTDGAGATWTVAPVDLKGVMIDRKRFTPTGEELVSYGFPVVTAFVRDNLATLACGPLVAGKSVTCNLNIGALSISPSDFTIVSLRNGDATEVCPKPSIAVVSATMVSITFTPDIAGREGALQMTYLGQPLLFNANANHNAYYDWSLANVTGFSPMNERVIPSEDNDAYTTRFFILPGPEEIFPYDNTNYFNLATFTNIGTGWTTQNGVQWYPSRGTLTDEPLAATLASSTNLSTIYQDVTLTPGVAERCRITIRYFFTAEISTTLLTDAFIGRVKVTAFAGATPYVIRNYELYSYLRTVIIVGEDNVVPGQLDGGIRTGEQLSIEVPVLATYTAIRLELTADHSKNNKLYFIEPVAQCAVTAPVTNAGDVTALQTLWTALGPGLLAGTWRSGGGTTFNGDPCRNSWQGVLCRRNRVVGLALAAAGLKGTMPSLSAMTALETIDLRNNEITGVFDIDGGGAGTLLRLKEVRIDHNLFTSILKPATSDDFVLKPCACLRHFSANNNTLTYLPATGLTDKTLLHTFEVGRNLLANTLPTNLNTMTSLAIFKADRNLLTGTLPATIPTVPIRSLDVSNNKLYGGIPTSYTNLRNLQFFDISHNMLNASLPVITLGRVRAGYRVVFNVMNNYFKYLPPRHHFGREAVGGNFFQCPLADVREMMWLPNGVYYAQPNQCDAALFGVEL